MAAATAAVPGITTTYRGALRLGARLGCGMCFGAPHQAHFDQVEGQVYEEGAGLVFVQIGCQAAWEFFRGLRRDDDDPRITAPPAPFPFFPAPLRAAERGVSLAGAGIR